MTLRVAVRDAVKDLDALRDCVAFAPAPALPVAVAFGAQLADTGLTEALGEPLPLPLAEGDALALPEALAL